MIKAEITLLNGATVKIEGPKDEVKRLLDFYSGAEQTTAAEKLKASDTQKLKSPKTFPIDIATIASLIKSCPEAENIEKAILEHGREADRALLPLYIIHRYLDSGFGLTTVEISDVLSQLPQRAHVTRQNVNRDLVRTWASKYVVTDVARKPGAKPHYSINDRGVQYLQAVILGAQGNAPPKKVL